MKENQGPVSLLIIDAKVLDLILANRIHHYRKHKILYSSNASLLKPGLTFRKISQYN